MSQEIGYYVNISESFQIDRNPQLYEGLEYSYYKDIILIWESERNNNWQLWSSIFSMPMGGIGNNVSNGLHLKTYPNPFTTSTNIEYELNAISNIQFTVYNVMGEEVYRTEESMMPQGRHTVTWSPSHLPKGLYYAVLKSEKGVSVVKIIKQ